MAINAVFLNLMVSPSGAYFVNENEAEAVGEFIFLLNCICCLQTT